MDDTKPSKRISLMARLWAQQKPLKFEVKAPTLAPGVLPANLDAAKADGYMALDDASMQQFYQYAGTMLQGRGFPGYPFLAELAQISEYRAPSEVTAKEMCRKWIKIVYSGDNAEADTDKIGQIEEWFKKKRVRSIFQHCAEHDGFYGRGQIYIDIKGIAEDREKRKLPLIIDKATIKPGSVIGFKTIEPIWTTPFSYNSIDPTAPDFFKPNSWFVLGVQTHSTRLMTMISREVPDLLKPAYNFGGISLSQLMQPYVDRWLSTAQSVNRTLHAFSITGIKTDLSSVLDNQSGDDLFSRVDFFNATRDNRGLMVLQQGDANSDGEEFFQLNTPLSGLSELQAQAQEHMAAPSHIPLVKLLGITPTGLNASSEGEITVFNDWIKSMQEAIFSDHLSTVLKLAQLDMFGEIDPSITFEFEPMVQMNAKELSDIRKADAETAGALLDRSVISVEEERRRLANDPNSGYNSLDVDDLPELSTEGQDDLGAE